MSSSLTPSGAAGIGYQNLDIDMGKNTLRENKTYTCSLKRSGSSATSDTLTITQTFTPLSNSYSGASSATKTASSSAQTVTFSGTANGKYLKCESNSQYLTITSCTENSGGSAHSIGTSYTQVSNFQGGSSSYGYTVTLSLAANAPATTDGYTVDVTTADSSNPGASIVYKRFTVKVTAAAVAVTGIDLKFRNNDYSAIQTGTSREAYVEITPANATVGTIVWGKDNNVISISPNDDVCNVTGLRDGGSTLSVTVTDTQGHSFNDQQGIVVRDPGSITLYDLSTGVVSDSNITILSMSESAQAGVVLYNIDTTQGFSYNVVSGNTWIGTGSSSIDYTSNPNTVTIASILPNNSSPSGRTGKVTVTATKDLLGNPVTSNELTIFQEYNSTIPCTSMEISGSDSDPVIFNSNNYRDYTITYYPSPSTTQKGCTWTLTDTGGNPLSANIAALGSSSNSGARIIVGTSANNSSFILKATNTYNSSIVATRTITATYYENPEVVITNVSGGYVDINYDDSTNETPRVSFTNSTFASLRIWADAQKTTELSTSDAACIFSANPTLVETSAGSGVYKLVTSIKTNNTQSDKTNYIEIVATDPDHAAVSAMVQYVQGHIGPAGNDFEFVTTSGYEPKVERGIGSSYTLSCRIAWTNNATVQTTFTTPQYELSLYQNASDAQPTFTHTGSFSDVTVAGNTTLNVDHTDNMTGAMDVSEYGRIVLSVYTVSLAGVTRTYDSSNNPQ